MVSRRPMMHSAERRTVKLMRIRRLGIVMLLAVLFASCRSFASDSPTADIAPEPSILPETSTPSPDYVTRIRNSDYQLGFVDSLRIVQLTDGKFEQDSPGGEDYVSVTVTDFTARGDLNGDGFDEYAAIIVENYGGTGVFAFLVIFSDENGNLVFQTSTFIGDRPQLTELSIKGREVYLDATIQKANDPMCCPTLKTARHYRLVNNYLDMRDYITFTPDGRPRAITIDSPAAGTGVFSSVRIMGTVTIAPFENNLVYRIFDVGGVELAIGSITVSSPEPGTPGTFDQTIKLGYILSGAVIRIEVQDVSAEDGSLLAMCSVVELVVK